MNDAEFIETVIGKSFYHAGTDAESTIPQDPTIFTIEKVKHNFHRVVNVRWTGDQITYEHFMVRKFFTESAWVFILEQKQYEWLKLLSEKMSLSYEDAKFIQTIILREYKYYTLNERDKLNELRERYLGK